VYPCSKTLVSIGEVAGEEVSVRDYLPRDAAFSFAEDPSVAPGANEAFFLLFLLLRCFFSVELGQLLPSPHPCLNCCLPCSEKGYAYMEVPSSQVKFALLTPEEPYEAKSKNLPGCFVNLGGIFGGVVLGV
jgi:hypothetical protein